MPRDKFDVESDIVKLTGSYSGGVCLACDKKIKEGSQKVVNGYDICWGCWVENPDPRKDYLMYLLHEYEEKIKLYAQQEQKNK